jgi:hypothetical protein
MNKSDATKILTKLIAEMKSSQEHCANLQRQLDKLK